LIHCNAKEAIVVVARGKLRVLKAHSPAKELEILDSGRKKLEFGFGRKKSQISMRLTLGGGGAAVIIGGIPSLERFQVDPYGKSRIIGSCSALRWVHLLFAPEGLKCSDPSSNTWSELL